MRSKRVVPSLFVVCLTAVLAGVAVLVCPVAHARMTLDAGAVASLNAGEAIVRISADETGEADGHIEAAIDIAATPEKVFAAMVDCARALKFVAELTECKILESSADGRSDVREHHSRWLSILPEMVSVFRSDYVPNREIRFARVRGDLAFLKGSWQLEPLRGGTVTRVLYDARVGISMPLPGFMIRGALEADVPKLLKALRTEVVSGAGHAPAKGR
ncbi:MAG: SRPBCC family protein [Hyphomicrobium sp.]